MGDLEISESLTGAGERPNWVSLRAFHGSKLVASIQVLARGGGRLSVTAADLAGRANSTDEAATGLLDALENVGWLKVDEVLRCPDVDCDELLAGPPNVGDACPKCHQYFADIGDPIKQRVYSRTEPRPRLVDWVITLHGMNTRGEWQEKLSWLIALAYGRAVPVAIYKYGMIRPGVLFPWRQRQLRDRVIRQIRTHSLQAELAGYKAEPDVIAHSFGTWLLAHALQHDPELKVGRVILTGSIVRPDFDWQALLERKQIEAILNHYGTRDCPVGVTHFFIPDSGPGGRHGFDNPGPINVKASGFGHSTFFGAAMEGVFSQVWTPFLTANTPGSGLLVSNPTSTWIPAPWLLRAELGRWLVIAAIVGLATFGACALIFGSIDITKWTLSFF